MKKIKYIIVLAMLLVPVLPILAANSVSTTASSNIDLVSPSMRLTLATGASYSSLTVTDSTIAFTLSAEGSISISSAQGYLLTNDQNAAIACPSSGSASTVTYSLAAGAADSTITFTPSLTKCWPADNPTYNAGSGSGSGSGSSGGGGGSTPTVATPTTDAGDNLPADQSAGDGVTTDNIVAHGTGNVGEATVKGKNVLMGESATATFSLSAAISSTAGSHTLQVQNITGNQATVTISSEPIVFTVLVGAKKNVDIDGDGYRDVSVALNRITDNKADITIKEIKVVKITAAAPGSLVKIVGKSAVYYLGEDSQRYVFPNEKVFYSWYNNFNDVITITNDDMALLPIGGLVTYRPGTRMVKFATNADVYTVNQSGVLRKLKDEAMARELYGENWNKQIDDINDAFYSSYAFGSNLETSSAYNKETQKTYTPTITVDKNL